MSSFPTILHNIYFKMENQIIRQIIQHISQKMCIMTAFFQEICKIARFGRGIYIYKKIIQLQTEVFSFEKNNKNKLFITSVEKRNKKIYKNIMVYPNMNVICFRMANCYSAYSCRAYLTFCTTKNYFCKMFCNCIFYILG